MTKYIYILCAKEEAKKNSYYDNGYRIAYHTSLKKAKNDSENKSFMKELKEKERHVKGEINLYIARYPVGLTSCRDLGNKYKEWKRVESGSLQKINLYLFSKLKFYTVI